MTIGKADTLFHPPGFPVCRGHPAGGKSTLIAYFLRTGFPRRVLIEFLSRLFSATTSGLRRSFRLYRCHSAIILGYMSTRNTSSSCRKLNEKVASFRIFALSLELGYFWIPQVLFRRCGSGHREMVVDSLMDAVAGARQTPGRLETGGVPSKPPATILLSVPSVFWDFGSLYQKALRRHLLRAVAAAVFSSCRCGDSGFVSQAGRTSHCDVSAPPVSSELPDGCTTHVLGLRIGVSVALPAPVVLTVRGSGNLFLPGAAFRLFLGLP